MKTRRSIFHSQAILAALLLTGAPMAIAQTVDTSKRTATDSERPLNDTPVPNPVPASLTAIIQPADTSVAVSGLVTFAMVGDAVSASGRISSLEPNKRYQAVILLPPNPMSGRENPVAPAPPPPATPADPSPAAGEPSATPAPGEAAGATETPAPAPPLESRPGIAGLVSPAPELDLGMLTSDAQGIANLIGTLTHRDLSPPPNGIQGGTLVIRRAPPLDSRDERTPVGSGLITASGAAVPVTPPVR